MVSSEDCSHLHGVFPKAQAELKGLMPAKQKARTFGVLIAALLMTASVFGQTITSSITGTVQDSSGAVVPGASIIVTDSSQGITRRTTANSTGSYLIAALPAGTYRLTVSAKGFKTYGASGIILQAARKVRADVTLEVGAVSTEVTVQGSSIGQVHTQTSELGGTVTGRQMTQLELNGRDFAQLVTLVPGVSNQTGQDEGTVGVYGSTAYAVNGGRTEYNNWEVDGISMMDMGSGSNIVVTYPSIDAIGEERVLTSNYGAQYGQTSSGTVVAVLKSGTSEFHGDAYEFNRNETFNARNFFDQGRGAYKKNDFGYTFGGPFYIPGLYNTDKSKTFFFWSQEWRREVAPSAFDSPVPSVAERQGDFSDVCPNAVTGSFADCPKDPATNAYFPGNQVPVDPNAQTLMGMVPAPSFGSGSLSFFRASPSFPTDWREELIRVDQNITPKIRMMVHYIHDSWNTVTPTTLWSSGDFPTVNTIFSGPGTSFVSQLTTAISPTLLNEFIFGYSDDNIFLGGGGYWKVPSGFTMKGLFNNGFAGKLPSISVCCNAEYGGFTEDNAYLNPANTHYNSNPIYNFRDMVTKIAGNHNLTFGADFIAIQKNQQNTGDPSANGLLTFDNTSAVSTGNAFADFLAGRIAQYQQLNAILKYYERAKSFAPYIQDDWHVSRRLTLNLGFRADFLGAWHNKFHKESSFSPGSYTLADAPEIDQTGSATGVPGALIPGTGNPFDGLVTCGEGGVPASCVKGHLFNPAPRLGIAWDPAGHGTTAIRAGYGIFYEQMNGNEVGTQSLEGTPPFALTPSVFRVVGYGNIGGAGLNFPLNTLGLANQLLWPYVQQWNASVEHNFGAHTVVSVAYVGSKGTHLTDQRDLNQLFPTPGSQNPFGPAQRLTPDACDSLTANGQPVTGQALMNLNVACGNVGPVVYRPFLGYDDITILENGASSDYNALQVYLRKMVGRLNFSLAYTYSHSLDDSSDRYDGSFLNSYNMKQNYASSDFDQTHMLNASYVYNFPFFQHSPSRLLQTALGGWEVSGITGFHTGSPFSVINHVFGDNAGVGNGVGTGSRPDVCGDIHAVPAAMNIPGIIGPLLLNPGAFCAPRGLTFGNAGRNILRQPHYLNWNIGVFKDFPIYGERAHVQFRAEAFNVFNEVNFSAGGSARCYAGPRNSAGDPSCVSSSGFLHANGASAPRIMQFGLKLVF